MKRMVAGLVLVGLLAALVMAPSPAEARWHRGPGFAGGLAVGAVTGVILGGILAPRVVYPAPPPVVYEPAPVYVQPAPVYAQPAPVYVATPPPVYVAPPPPVCQDYWVPQQYRGGVWVQGHWERACQ